MGIFSKKKEENKTVQAGISSSIVEWNKQEANKIPKILPNTLMQNISIAQNKNQEPIVPQKIYTEDIKASLKMKTPVNDEHKKIPEDIHEVRDRDQDRREIEKIIMMESIPVPQPPLVPQQKSIIPAATSSKPEGHHHSFFAELERIFGQKHDMKHIMSQDMMSKMKDYHEAMGKGDSFFIHELDIEREIEKSLASLKEIESEWLLTKRGVASAERLLFEKEEELERKLGDFRTLLTSADKFKKLNDLAPEGSAFLLSGGVKLYSIQHLINELPKMSENVFFSHVTPDKNDFAAWIHGVFRLEDLAARLGSAKTKQEIIDILKKY